VIERWLPTRAGRAGPCALAAIAAAFLAVGLVEAWPFTVDDTFITLRYSRNVAEGLGPTFNALGPRAEGYTTFLWMLLLVAPHRLGLDAPTFAKGLGTAATLATFALLARWAWVEAESAGSAAVASAGSPAAHGTSSNARAWAAATAAACFASLPATAVHAVSGMETALFTTLLTALFVASAAHVRGRRGWGGPNGIVVCALLASLTRPEGNLAALVVLAMTATLVTRADRRALVARALVGWVAPMAIYELWRRRYYGLTFPLPFYVKLATPGLLPGWPDVVEWLGGPALRFAVLLGPALARPPRSLRPALAALIVLTGFFVLPQHQMGYDHRYLAPLDPTLAVLAGLGFSRLMMRATHPRAARAIAAAGLAVALGVNAAGARRTISGEADYGRGLAAAHERLGRELFAIGLPESRLVISDAGAAPYFSRWWTLDLVGLNDAHIATTGRPAPAWVLAQDPDVVVLASASTDRFETWDWNPWESTLLEACTAAGFARIAVRRFAPDYWLWVLARPGSPAARALPEF